MKNQFQLICNYFSEANIFIQIIALITSLLLIILNTILIILPCLILCSIKDGMYHIKDELINKYYMYKIRKYLRPYPIDIIKIINKYNPNPNLPIS